MSHEAKNLNIKDAPEQCPFCKKCYVFFPSDMRPYTKLVMNFKGSKETERNTLNIPSHAPLIQCPHCDVWLTTEDRNEVFLDQEEE